MYIKNINKKINKIELTVLSSAVIMSMFSVRSPLAVDTKDDINRPEGVEIPLMERVEEAERQLEVALDDNINNQEIQIQQRRQVVYLLRDQARQIERIIKNLGEEEGRQLREQARQLRKQARQLRSQLEEQN